MRTFSNSKPNINVIGGIYHVESRHIESYGNSLFSAYYLWWQQSLLEGWITKSLQDMLTVEDISKGKNND